MNAYLLLLMLFVISTTVGATGLLGSTFKIDPWWFQIIGFSEAFILALAIGTIELIVKRQRARQAAMVAKG